MQSCYCYYHYYYHVEKPIMSYKHKDHLTFQVVLISEKWESYGGNEVKSRGG